jgi:hypothetical protein
MAFMAINVLLFLFGVAASFLRHDPHPDYERAVEEARRTDQALARAEKRHGAAVRDETARYEERKRSIDTQIGELRAAIAALSDQSAGIGRHCLDSRRAVAQAIRTRCGNFAEGFNAAGRARAAAPEMDTILRELPRPEDHHDS